PARDGAPSPRRRGRVSGPGPDRPSPCPRGRAPGRSRSDRPGRCAGAGAAQPGEALGRGTATSYCRLGETQCRAPYAKPSPLVGHHTGQRRMPCAQSCCARCSRASWPAPPRPRLSIEYSLRIDPSHLDAVAVAIHIDGAPDTLRLAMKVHPGYDAKYWRYLDSIRVDGAASNLGTGVTREDSTLWRITLLHGSGTVRYRVHVQPANGMVRAWRPLVRATGAMINSPDFLLYLPDFASAPVVLNLDVPRGWRIATSLEPHGAPPRFAAPSAAVL